VTCREGGGGIRRGEEEIGERREKEGEEDGIPLDWRLTIIITTERTTYISLQGSLHSVRLGLASAHLLAYYRFGSVRLACIHIYFAHLHLQGWIGWLHVCIAQNRLLYYQLATNFLEELIPPSPQLYGVFVYEDEGKGEGDDTLMWRDIE